MRVFSIDIGIKNLAMCVLEQDTAMSKPRICRWELVSLRGKGLAEVVHSLFGTMRDRRDDLTKCDKVLIERQAGLNRKMSVVSHCVQTWCLCNGIAAAFCDPRGKLQAFEGHPCPAKLPNDNYARTKALAKWHAQRFLDETHGDSEFRNTLRRASKADDLADALVQAISWLNMNLELSL